MSDNLPLHVQSLKNLLFLEDCLQNQRAEITQNQTKERSSRNWEIDALTLKLEHANKVLTLQLNEEKQGAKKMEVTIGAKIADLYRSQEIYMDLVTKRTNEILHNPGQGREIWNSFEKKLEEASVVIILKEQALEAAQKEALTAIDKLAVRRKRCEKRFLDAKTSLEVANLKHERIKSTTAGMIHKADLLLNHMHKQKLLLNYGTLTSPIATSCQVRPPPPPYGTGQGHNVISGSATGNSTPHWTGASANLGWNPLAIPLTGLNWSNYPGATSGLGWFNPSFGLGSGTNLWNTTLPSASTSNPEPTTALQEPRPPPPYVPPPEDSNTLSSKETGKGEEPPRQNEKNQPKSKNSDVSKTSENLFEPKTSYRNEEEEESSDSERLVIDESRL